MVNDRYLSAKKKKTKTVKINPVQKKMHDSSETTFLAYYHFEQAVQK